MDEDAKKAFDALALKTDEFQKIVAAAVMLSGSNLGVPHTGRQNRALFVFAKMILHNMSMHAILQKCLTMPKGVRLLDHFSLATLARTMIDAGLMTMYISQPTLTRDEWNLRRYVLYLHDLDNRKRFISGSLTPDVAFLESYPAAKAERIRKIRSFAKALSLSAEATSELTKGQKVFVSGSRGAVREAQWDLQYYDFNQSYLSAFVHSHPVSFMRADEHNISFQEPSMFQINFCIALLNLAGVYTESVTKRMVSFSDSKFGDPLGQVDD